MPFFLPDVYLRYQPGCGWHLAGLKMTGDDIPSANNVEPLAYFVLRGNHPLQSPPS